MEMYLGTPNLMTIEKRMGDFANYLNYVYAVNAR